MTTNTFDDRAAAYIGARERLTAAERLKLDRKNRVVEPLPELYWATLAEAAILADLARTDVQVGLRAGSFLVEQNERIEVNKARIRGAIKHAKRGSAIADAIDDDEDQDDEPVEDDGCRCNSFAGNCPEHGPR